MLLMIEKVIILKSIDLFCEISEKDLLSLATQLSEIEYEKGSVIIRQGEIGTSMYIIVRGEVEVIIDDKVVARLGEKSIFGELAALDPEPRSAAIKATQDTLVFKIESTVMYNLISEYIDVAKGIIKILCQRVRQNSAR
ncbi:MAG: cyclic nucleotide-binding domain-containing protein [Campylobacterales bacterium]|nr:cyclic nucleotide-binding domain-containing protein [Campylobacterales bacterium]